MGKRGANGTQCDLRKVPVGQLVENAFEVELLRAHEDEVLKRVRAAIIVVGLRGKGEVAKHERSIHVDVHDVHAVCACEKSGVFLEWSGREKEAILSWLTLCAWKPSSES